MNLLAFDTCFGAVSVAVRRADVITAAFERCDTGHAERLMPMVARLMREAGMTFGDLDRIAVTLGPGGFTGLRVGIAAARAFAVASGKPIVGISSLNLMALTAIRRDPHMPASRLVVAVDARKSAYYVQAFDAPTASPLTEPALMTADEAIAAFGSAASTLVGNGADRVRAGAPISTPWTTRLPDLEPDAADLARRAATLTPLPETRPLYLRAADAKPQTGTSLPRAAS